jgi:predicted aspartyl protease
VVRVVAFRPFSRISKVGRGKIDSGADITVIPIDWAERLALLPSSVVKVRSYYGREEEVETYFIRMEFSGFQFPLIEVLVSNRKDVLIGRDVLNRLRAELDGKKLELKLTDP